MNAMTPTPKELPALPEPARTAYVEGPAMQGGEYRTLCTSYEPDCAMYSPVQMQAYARAAVAASLQGIERDAARYRWLSANYMPPSCEEAWDAMDTSLLQGGTGLDAAIDAAMKDAQ